jgi:uncharacterized protein YndB with AHSA1/START domain
MKKRIEGKLLVAAEPQRLFRALTTAQELTQWFCEYAEVSLAERRYDFWGRLTPDAPDQDCGRHPLLILEPNRRFGFAWQLSEAETIVEVYLQAQNESTLVTLIHEGASAHEPGEANLADFWALSLENLRAWVERGVTGPRCDFSEKPSGDVYLNIDITAPQAAVYAALIRPHELERYIATRATVDPRTGGRYDFGWENGGPVKILDLVPEERLSYSWTYGDQPETVVTWTLAGSGGSTRLTLVHSGFTQDRKSRDYKTGWLKYLNRIKNLVEVGSRWQQPILRVSDFSSN